MTRPVVPDSLRLVLVALGVCCLIIPLVAFWGFRDCKFAEGTVIIYPVVAFTCADETKTEVRASSIPADVRPGDRFTVIYDPRRSLKDSWLLVDVVRIPGYAGLVGIAFMSFGLLARRPRRAGIKESQANRAQQAE